MWKAAVLVLAGSLVAVLPAQAAAPGPVYAPDNSVADPGVLRSGGDFYAFTTGPKGRVSRGDTASGPWQSVGAALDLSTPPAWMDTSADVWAPDAWQTSAGYVLYYSAVAKSFGGQRCIGVATSSGIGGPYTPIGDTPLVCPGGRDGGEDAVPGRPIAAAGVIDPSPFQDSEGRRFLLYKTQQVPSSLRMVRLTDAGLHWAGSDSRELLQRDGIIENPTMVQRGSQYVLFASRYGYDNCSYATVWLRSTDRWNFAGATEQVQQVELATLLQQPPRFARSMKINPMLSQFLQRRERGKAPIDCDLRCLLERHALHVAAGHLAADRAELRVADGFDGDAIEPRATA